MSEGVREGEGEGGREGGRKGGRVWQTPASTLATGMALLATVLGGGDDVVAPPVTIRFKIAPQCRGATPRV